MADFTIRPKGAALSAEIDLDGETPYNLDHELTDWGTASQPDPQDMQTLVGNALILPHAEAWQKRTIRLVGWMKCSSWNDKLYQLSQLANLLQGDKTLRRHGWEIDAFVMAPVEREGSKKTPAVLEWEALAYATVPFWRMAQTLVSVQYDTLLYPDYGIPSQEAMPAYLFGRDLTGSQAIAASPGTGFHLTITNWGTGFQYPEISITGAPPSTDIYIKGSGRFRVKKTTTSGGAATITATDRLYLAPGANGIRFESANNTAIDLSGYTTMRVDFGATKYRFK